MAHGRAPGDVDGDADREEQETCVPEDREPCDGAGRCGERKRLPFVRDQRAEREERQRQPVEHLAIQVDVVPDDVRVQRRDRRGDEADAGRAEPRPDREDDQRRRDRDGDLREPDREPGATERQVDRREEPSVERLGVRRGDAGKEAERPVIDERRCETVALVDELLEDRLALACKHQETRNGRDHDHDSGSRRPFHLASASMGATSRERYAVVSCHVERPLDDSVWASFAALQDARPGGFAIAALMRPPDAGQRRGRGDLGRARS